MSLKSRLAKLEAAQALKAKPVEEYDPEVLDMEMATLIRSINDGSYRLTHPVEPWVIRPAPNETDILGTHLHNTMNRLAEKDLREQKEREEGRQLRV